MVIYILSRSKHLYSTSRIFEEAKKNGHSIRIINHMFCDLLIENNEYRIIYEGEILEKPDYIIPRIGANVTSYGEKVIRHFEKMGVKTSTSSRGLLISRDKFKCIQHLIEKNIPVPTTFFSNDFHGAEMVVNNFLGYPFILKLIEGTHGVGVFLVENQEEANRYFDLYSGSRNRVIIQKFIHESRGRDIRIIIAGYKVIAAMERVAPENEFRSNIHRGGIGNKIVLTELEKKIAIDTAKTLNLKLAGIDIIRSKEGPLLLEVNSSPGIEGIEKSTKLNVADAIITSIENDHQ